MPTFADNLNFFINGHKMKWKTFLTYRTQAAVWIFAEAITIINSIVAITVIYTVSSGIPGWSYFQVLALSGIAAMMLNSAQYLINSWDVVNKLRIGELDMWFTKPYSYLTILFSGFGNITAFAGIISGLGLFLYSVAQLHIQTVQLLYFIPLFLTGTLAFIMFYFMLTMVAYYFLKSAQFVGNMEDVLSNAGRYPLSVYGIIGQLIFTIAIPIGIAYYYPAEALFGFIGTEGIIAAFVLSIIVILVSRRIIYGILKSYSSGGG